jgi:hypothetical protein
MFGIGRGDTCSFRTVLCILFEARIIAAACFILAQRLIEGPNSPSLDARIASTAPSASLPTPPSNKPNTPDASRFAVLQLQLSEAETMDLAGGLGKCTGGCASVMAS